ncbi:MAG: hypothetical protein HOD64_08920 [Candidatus Cloacimonetes bacterium]|nr:hypothetical protein [Candidatus Cloacimonadota bacterium]MBT4333388.1 hypothetical protein [Candidatus Cloacimonadota bacterium]
MNIGIRIVGFIMIISLIVVGCTQKDNIVGTNGPGGPSPINTTIDQTNFTQKYSYEDSCAFSNSNTMVLGNYNTETSYGLLRFTSLPDSFYDITRVSISLEISKRNEFDVVDNTTLKLATINNVEFYENATWWVSSDSTQWSGEHFSDADYTDLPLIEFDIECEEDSIYIELDTDILAEWIDGELNTGLVIYSETDGFMEIYASEYSTDENPTLTFEYKITEADTSYTTETIQTCYDCMIFETDNIYDKWEDELKISNIQPINIYTKFNILESAFVDVLPFDYEIANNDTALFLQRITINKAELILNNNGTNSYPISGSTYLNPYFVISDTLNFDPANLDIPLLSFEDVDDLYISSSTDTLQTDQIIIDVTKIIQYYISGEYENKGIVLRSLNVNDDFIHTEFDIEPEIRITFTPPYIEE